MNLFRKIMLLMTVVFASSLCLLGQSGNRLAEGAKEAIAGRVKDAITGAGLPAATATLLDRNTLTPKMTVQTDTNGVFVFGGVAAGQYLLRLSCVGYGVVTRDSIVLGSGVTGLSLGDILMNKTAGLLTEVEIVAKGPALRAGLDKKVFAVNQSLVSTGGSAADLLQNIPTLQVDANGNIGLRGATNIKVLVNGKQSLIGGGSVVQLLQSIPAGAIERVEVITNPSAKYDAEGQGVINIILKKGGGQGLNGSVTATAGTRDNYGAGATLNYRTDRIDLYGNYSFQRRNTYSNGYQDMSFLQSGDATYYSNETFPSTTISDVHVVQAGIDYKIGPRDLLSVGGWYNSSVTHRNEYLTVDNLTESYTPVQLSNRRNITTGWNTSWGTTVDFVHKFKRPSEELAFDFAWSTGSGNSVQEYTTFINNINGQTVKGLPAVMQDDKRNKSSNYNLQADYSLPIGKGGRLEAGVRSQIATNDNQQWDANLDTLSGKYAPDYSLINFFKSTNSINAAYLNYRQKIRDFTLQAGLRAEAGNFDATLRSYDSTGALVRTPVSVITRGLYPAVFLTRILTNGQQLQISYTRRINRPTAREINPFWDVSDPVNYEQGNPHIRPEDLNALEFTYKKNWPRVDLTTGLYYNQVNNVIKHIQTDPVNDIVITIAENLRRAINTGVELIGNVHLTRIWSFTANVNVYDRINSAAPQYGITATSGISWNANITNDVSIVKGLSVQVRADYKASEFILQDRYRVAWGLDGGARYELFHGRGSLALNARDIFNTRRWRFLRVSDGLLLDFERVTYSARAALTFTYRFGRSSGEPKRTKPPEDQPAKRIESR